MGFPVAGFESGQRYRARARRHLRRLVSEVRHDLGAVHRLPARERRSPARGRAEARRRVPASRGSRRGARACVAGAAPDQDALPFARTPWSVQAKYLYVARNPFDCAVSFYHHTRGFVRHYDFAEGTWETFFDCFLRGEVDFGDYFDHLVSWWPHRAAAERAVPDLRAHARGAGGRGAVRSRDSWAAARASSRAIRAASKASSVTAISGTCRATKTAGRVGGPPACRRSCAKASSAIGAAISRPTKRAGSPRSFARAPRARVSETYGPVSWQTRSSSAYGETS